MQEKEVFYYLIWGSTLAKREESGEHYNDYLFKNGKWIKDEDHIIMDHLFGFDPTESDDSPYQFGSMSVMMEMDEISEDEALSIMNKQISSD